MTRVDGMIGSVLYMSPEQIRGERNLDRRVDIYSLGILLFEMLAGRVPFNGTTTYTTMHMHVHEPIPSIISIRPDVPNYLQGVIEMACAKNRDFRFGSAEEMAAALRAPVPAVVSDVPPNPLAVAPVFSGGGTVVQGPFGAVGAVGVPPEPRRAVSPTEIAMQAPTPISDPPHQDQRLAEGPREVSRHETPVPSEQVWVYPMPGAGGDSAARGSGVPMVGTMVGGRYRIESRLDSTDEPGFFKDALSAPKDKFGVFSAHDIALDVPVALNWLSNTLFGDCPEIRACILAEGRVLARIDHQNLVRPKAVIDDRIGIFQVMEVVDGDTLEQTIADYASQRTFMPVQSVLRHFDQILLGVSTLHAVGLIHGGIRPSSILVRRKDSLYLLTGFGFARYVDDAMYASRRAYEIRDWTVGIYTPIRLSSMPPEETDGEPNLNRQADVYALGTLLFQMLTNIAPFDGDSLFDTVFNIQCAPLPSLKHLRPDVPEYFQAIVEKACAKNPKDRFNTAAEMAAALHAGQSATDERQNPPSEPPSEITNAPDTAAEPRDIPGWITAVLFGVLIIIPLILAMSKCGSP